MSLNTNISNSGISANTELTCKKLNAQQISLSGSAYVDTTLQVVDGITLGDASTNGVIGAFAGKDLFVASPTTAYITGQAEVRIRGAGDASVCSFTTARHESVVPIVIQDNATCYLQLPKLTTAQRDALTAVKGMLIYNSTTDKFNAYDGAWREVTIA